MLLADITEHTREISIIDIKIKTKIKAKTKGKIVHVLLTLFCYSFLMASLAHPVLAEEKKEISVTAKKDKTASQETNKNKETLPEKIKIVPPIALTEQHKKDLQHYINNEQVKPLLAGPDSYLTLIKKHTNVNNKGVALLLPDWQQGATNPKAINFLRNALPNEGWTTITVQPNTKPEGYPSNALLLEDQIKENKICIDEYQSKQKTMFNALMNLAKEYPGIVIVIAQGNNAALLVELFSDEGANDTKNNGLQKPNAIVLLSSYRQTSNELINPVNEQFATQLALSELPVLDLYLQHDHPLAMTKAAERKSFAEQEMKVYYRQRQLNNRATGYYPEQELLSQLNSWLKSIGW